MLNISSPFPQPGSHALYQEHLWRIFQILPGHIALLTREGDVGGRNAATLTTRAPLADLICPESDLATGPHARLGLALAAALSGADIILSADLRPLIDDMIARGRLDWRPTVAQVEAALYQLNWRRTLLNRRHAWRRTSTRDIAALETGDAA